MTITLQLDAELEARLSAEARVKGLPLQTYFEGMVARAVTGEARPRLTAEEFEAALDELSDGSERLPVLPPEAFRRESIYGDDECPV
ncbi:MAG: hypothetical protein ABSG86_26470 [Thermoguttaceae bacterium]